MKLLKALACITSVVTVNLLGLTSSANAQQSSEICQGLRQTILQQVPANSPPLLTPEYNQYWFQYVPALIADLQRQYPQCSIGSANASDPIDNSLYNSAAEVTASVTESWYQSALAPLDTTMVIVCNMYGQSYDREEDACAD